MAKWSITIAGLTRDVCRMAAERPGLVSGLYPHCIALSLAAILDCDMAAFNPF
jgi:hypothetical protein